MENPGLLDDTFILALRCLRYSRDTFFEPLVVEPLLRTAVAGVGVMHLEA